MQARTIWIAGGILLAVSTTAVSRAAEHYHVDLYFEGILGLARMDDGRYRVVVPDLTDPDELPSPIGPYVLPHQPRIWFAEANYDSSSTVVDKEMRCTHPNHTMSYVSIDNQDIAPCDPQSVDCRDEVEQKDDGICPPRVCVDGDASLECTKCASIPFFEEYQSLEWLPNLGRLARMVDLSKSWKIEPDLLLDNCLCESASARATFQKGELSIGNFFYLYPHTVHDFKYAPNYPQQIMPHSLRLRLEIPAAEKFTIYSSILGRNQWSPLLQLTPEAGRDFAIFISNSATVDDDGECPQAKYDFLGHYLVLEDLPGSLPYPKVPGTADNAQCSPAEYRP